MISVWKHVPKEAVSSHVARLKNLIALTERELNLLAVVVTEMTQNGYDPYNERFVIQIDPSL